MPRDGSGVYSLPAGTTASPNTTIESSKYNAFGADLVADANAARPITAGGTGASNATDARTNLGLLGTNADGGITLTSTDTGGSAAPLVFLDRNSASPAVNDVLANVLFSGRDSAGNSTNYAGFFAQIVDPTDGSEDSTLSFTTAVAGTIAVRLKMGAGLYMTGATDPGAGMINATDVQVGGVSLPRLNLEDQVLTGGARVTSKSLGTGAGTITLDPGDRPLQHITNNAAFTLAPGSNTGSILLDVTNGASAGAITVSGWTKVVGAFTTTNGNKFRCSASIGNAGSLLSIQAMQ